LAGDDTGGALPRGQALHPRLARSQGWAVCAELQGGGFIGDAVRVLVPVLIEQLPAARTRGILQAWTVRNDDLCEGQPLGWHANKCRPGRVVLIITVTAIATAISGTIGILMTSKLGDSTLILTNFNAPRCPHSHQRGRGGVRLPG
jgi:hypothetical protein